MLIVHLFTLHQSHIQISLPLGSQLMSDDAAGTGPESLEELQGLYEAALRRQLLADRAPPSASCWGRCRALLRRPRHPSSDLKAGCNHIPIN